MCIVVKDTRGSSTRSSLTALGARHGSYFCREPEIPAWRFQPAMGEPCLYVNVTTIAFFTCIARNLTLEGNEEVLFGSRTCPGWFLQRPTDRVFASDEACATCLLGLGCPRSRMRADWKSSYTYAHMCTFYVSPAPSLRQTP